MIMESTAILKILREDFYSQKFCPNFFLDDTLPSKLEDDR